MSQTRWFPFLKGSERGDGVYKSALLDVEEPEPKTLIVSQEVARRSFAKFLTFFSFAKMFRTGMAVSHQCFYEVIFANLPQKPYFDLDIPLTQPRGLPLAQAVLMEGVPTLSHETLQVQELPTFSLTAEEAQLAVQRLVSSIMEVCPSIQATDIMVFNSHGPKKRSYHVVVDNWCFTDSTSNRGFHDKIMETYPSKWKQCIDHSMYKSIQQFRIYGCHKWLSERVKKVDAISAWIPPVDNEDDEHEWLQTLGGSLVTNASYCKILQSFAPIVPPKAAYTGDEIHLEETEIEESLLLCAKSEGVTSFDDRNFPYKISDVKGSLISLRRTMPSLCHMCKRKHESEHPYLTVVGAQRNVYFHCRRADGVGKLHIGCLRHKKPDSPGDISSYIKDIPVLTGSVVTGSAMTGSVSIGPVPLLEPPPFVPSVIKPITPPKLLTPQEIRTIPVLQGVSGIGLMSRMQSLQPSVVSKTPVNRLVMAIKAPSMYNLKFQVRTQQH